MKTEKIEELKKEIWEINSIMHTARISLSITEFLSVYDSEYDRQVKLNTYLRYDSVIHWRLVVIELSKLFSDRESDKFNLKKFINKLKKDGYYSEANISQGKIIKWESTLTSEQGTIKNLLDQRDRYYAHQDRIERRVQNIVTHQKTNELILEIQSIINEIYNYSFGESISFHLQEDPIVDLKNITDILIIEYKRIDDELESLH